MATFKMAMSKMAFHFCILSKHHFVSIFSLDQPHIVEGNKDNFRSSQPPEINCRCGRRHTRVCEYATERLVT